MPSVDYSMPAYVQIARYYAELIAKGDLSPGERLPSERELVETWSVSKATANRAVATLKSEGLVETRVGSGTVVAARATSDTVGVGPRDMFTRSRHDGQIRVVGETSTRTTGQSEGVDAPVHVVTALGGTEQSLLVWRRRVIERNGKPFSVARSWFLPAVIAADRPDTIDRLLTNESIPEGTPRFIAGRLGRELTEAVDNLSSILADEPESTDLGVELGSPLLYIVSTIYAGGWVIEVGEYFYLANVSVNYRYQV